MTQPIPAYRMVLFLPLTALVLALFGFFCLTPTPTYAQTASPTLILQDSTNETDFTTSLAWGDYDNDGDLDLVVGNGMVISDDLQLLAQDPQIRDFFVKSDRRNRLYCNDNGRLRLCWSSPENEFTTSVAWGDMDNDNDLDLAVGNAWLGIKAKNITFLGLTFPVFWLKGRSQSHIYRNNGNAPNGDPQFEIVWSSPPGDSVLSVAWGDYDKDTRLDLALAYSNHYMVVDVQNRGTPTYENEPSGSRIYRNVTNLAAAGQPAFTLDTRFQSFKDISFSLAWVDVDNDTDLDLAVANGKRFIDGAPDPNAGDTGVERIYCNQYNVQAEARLLPCWQSQESDFSTSMSWGDLDDNGFVDLAVGNAELWEGRPNDVYYNYGLDANGQLILKDEWDSDEADATISVALGDADGDGDLDLAAGNGNFDASQPNRIYCNEGGRLATTACWSSVEEDITMSVAWGDVDGDGALDLATGNFSVPIGQQNRLYHNDNVRFPRSFSGWSTEEGAYTRSAAWGDMDGDRDLDLILGNSGVDQLYCNQISSSSPIRALIPVTTFVPIWDETTAVAWGDMDGDHDLDLAVGNELGDPNRLYRNDGLMGECQPRFTLVLEWGEGEDTRSLAWGDMDGDGDLDLAVGNGGLNQFDLPAGQENHIYRNDGLDSDDKPIFTSVWISPEVDSTRSVAWGDVDEDGDLDLAVGNSAGFNRLYRNDGFSVTDRAVFTQVWSAPQLEDTNSIAWGDMDNDGDLDLAVGNTTQSSRVYCNEGGALSTTDCWHSVEAPRTRSIAWGDLDGDGDLDLAMGNQEGPNYIYLNQNGRLTERTVWLSDDSSITANGTNTSYTLSIVWADVDSDGDLDLFAGNAAGQPSGIYVNLGRALLTTQATPQISRILNTACRAVTASACFRKDTPPFARIIPLGATPGAAHFATAEVISATSAVTVTYQLFASQVGAKVRIFPEYSPNGGSQWFPATPGMGGDGVSNLEASPWPTGTQHSFIWNAALDIIKSDNVIFRIRAYAGQLHSPILWPALGSQSAPFRMAASWYVHVVNEQLQPVAGAALYAGGHFITVTNAAGLVGMQALTPTLNLPLVALAPQMDQPSPRANHTDGLAYRIYQTSLTERETGVNQPHLTTLTGEQRLTTTVDMPLVLFNLVVSIEWPAGITYTLEISRAMHEASTYLFDLTDGQMAFGHVQIYDNAQQWTNADIQISAKNTVHPHAYVGGITSTVASEVLRLGRGWDGRTGDHGAWDRTDGYRTIAHEFGHYGLGLYDEYFRYETLAGGNLGKRIQDVFCTHPNNREQDTASTNASAMDWQYTSSELSDRDQAGLWSALCAFSAQWQLTALDLRRTEGESAWETLVRRFADPVPPTTWRLLQPSARGAILPGPKELPAGLPDWPQITLITTTQEALPYTLTVFGPDGEPFANAGVTLYKANRGLVIEQGRTAKNGVLAILGALPGDVLRADSIDGAWAGSLVVTQPPALTLRLEAVGNQANLRGLLPALADFIPQRRSPYLRIAPALAQGNEEQIAVTFTAYHFDEPTGGQSGLTVIVSEPGGDTAQFTQAAYSPATDGAEGNYTGQLSFTARTEDINNVQVIGAVDKEVFFLHSSYYLQQVVNDERQTIRSSDGKLSLDLNPQSLPTSQSYFIVAAQSTIPGSLPEGYAVVGHVYDITTAGAVTHVGLTATLTIAYDANLLANDPAQAELALYWWDAGSQQWMRQADAFFDRDRAMLSAGIKALGAYAILAKQ